MRTKFDSITFNGNPILDEQVAKKIYVDDQLNRNTILRLNQSSQNYLKVTIGNTDFNFTLQNSFQIIDTRIIKYLNHCS